MKIGITGHQILDNQDWVTSEIGKILKDIEPPLIGITSLAIGADQLFAKSILDHSGTFEVIIPIEGYVNVFKGTGKEDYIKLLKLATETQTLEKMSSNEVAYLTAGKRIVDNSDAIIAVWNGKPAKGLGGTGDIVKYALSNNKKVFHINPDTKLTTIL